MRVAVVVVHFQFWPEIGPCLDSVLGQSLTPDTVLVVDDASGDGSVAAIRAAYPAVSVLEQSANSGYAAAVNAGVVACSDAEAVLVLSHETVLDRDALAHLSRTLGGRGVAVAGPLLGLLDDRERLWSAGGGLGQRSALPFHRQGVPLSGPSGDHGQDVEWVDGAAFLLDRRAWEGVGGLDESYYLYVEEVDFMQRLLAAGWSVRVNPAARAWQRPGMTPPYLEARNLALWMYRSHRYLPLLLHLCRQFTLALRAMRAEQGRWVARARMRGLLDAARGQLDRAWALRRSPAPPA
ncbi:MAG: N-acetylglucosaminyl-diphospho-decaprenol L-rhamnosyltransferase [Frankiales bacterium]|jgi:GT2 family glycosyltransferase|nr:N-acetylglucosaminyl-diphospho-decaprenol L-rhamnosyltransferase [Frankiales bacterium]